MVHQILAIAPNDFPFTIAAILIAMALWSGERAFRNHRNQNEDQAKDE